MARIEMPEAPKKHHWAVARRPGVGAWGADMLKVSLCRDGRFPLYVSEIVSWKWQPWHSDDEVNSRNAVKMADLILASTGDRGLNGLTGYKWVVGP